MMVAPSSSYRHGTEYKILQATSIDLLAAVVNRYLEGGGKVTGGVAAIKSEGPGYTYLQAVTKEGIRPT